MCARARGAVSNYRPPLASQRQQTCFVFALVRFVSCVCVFNVKLTTTTTPTETATTRSVAGERCVKDRASVAAPSATASAYRHRDTPTHTQTVSPHTNTHALGESNTLISARTRSLFAHTRREHTPQQKKIVRGVSDYVYVFLCRSSFCAGRAICDDMRFGDDVLCRL